MKDKPRSKRPLEMNDDELQWPFKENVAQSALEHSAQLKSMKVKPSDRQIHMR